MMLIRPSSSREKQRTNLQRCKIEVRLRQDLEEAGSVRRALQERRKASDA
jgi:hypothetical protein